MMVWIIGYDGMMLWIIGMMVWIIPQAARLPLAGSSWRYPDNMYPIANTIIIIITTIIISYE